MAPLVYIVTLNTFGSRGWASPGTTPPPSRPGGAPAEVPVGAVGSWATGVTVELPPQPARPTITRTEKKADPFKNVLRIAIVSLAAFGRAGPA